MAISHKNLKALFQNVFWPAATGNVFWSVCTMFADEKFSINNQGIISAILVLLLATIYLSIEWILNYETLPDKVSWKFWVFDFLLICAVAFIAISAPSRPNIFVWASAFFFAVVAIGHFAGAYKEQEANKQVSYKSVLISVLGLAIVLVGFIWPQIKPWNLPIASVVALILWVFIRKEELKNAIQKEN
jgi:hypothetical protein